MSYYQVKVDGVDIHDPQYKEMTLLNAHVSLAIGEAGSFEFTVSPDHVFYDKIVPYGSTIEVWEGPVAELKEMIFYGRPLPPHIDIYGRKTFHCEGLLACLADVVCPPGVPDQDSEIYSDAEYFAVILAYYNSQVAQSRRMVAPHISDFGSEMRETWDYQTAKEIIENEILPFTGGYLYTENISGVNYIVWVDENMIPVNSDSSGEDDDVIYANPQPISVGVNILDAMQECQPFYTAAIATGATIEVPTGEEDETTEQVVRLLEPVIHSQEAIERYGFICKKLEFPNLDTEQQLKAACLEWLSGGQFQDAAYTINAVDLQAVNNAYDKLHLARMVQVYIPQMGVNIQLPITKIETDINTGIKRVTVGKDAHKDVTRQVRDNRNKPQKEKENIVYDKDGNSYEPYVDVSDNYNVIAGGKKIPEYIKFTRAYDGHYEPGDVLDLSDYAVAAFYNDGTYFDVTAKCSFDIPDGYVFQNADNPDVLHASCAISGKTFSAGTPLDFYTLPAYIRITQPPDKTIYNVGETIDLDGIIVVAYNSDGTVWQHSGHPNGVIPLSELSCTPSFSMNSDKNITRGPLGDSLPWSSSFRLWTKETYDSGITYETTVNDMEYEVETRSLLYRRRVTLSDYSSAYSSLVSAYSPGVYPNVSAPLEVIRSRGESVIGRSYYESAVYRLTFTEFAYGVVKYSYDGALRYPEGGSISSAIPVTPLMLANGSYSTSMPLIHVSDFYNIPSPYTDALHYQLRKIWADKLGDDNAETINYDDITVTWDYLGPEHVKTDDFMIQLSQTGE